LGMVSFLVLPDRRRAAIENAARIMPGKPAAEARATARQCFRNLGVNFVEALLFPYLKKESYKERFCQVGGAYVEEALKTGRGILALGFHFANWEINGVTSFLLGHEIVALARPLKKNPGLNDLLIQLREATGLTIIPNRDTARDVVRLLKENRIIALLGDQREKRSKAVWVDLFGHKVPTSKGIVMIAMKTGAPVIPMYSRRDGFLRYTFICHEPILIERKGAPIEELIARNARRINEVIEEIVKDHPDEWFLVHRRFGRREKNR
jgi:Kdo2-lipid IVA lauroyltransferase/acyltransferase